MENKNKFKVAFFCILSAIIGIVIGYYCGETTYILENDDNKLLIGTYQDYVDTNNQLLSTINDIEDYDVYQELIWLEEIINQINYPDLKSDNEILEDYYNYYYATETLLDSLYKWQENYFLDVVFETDTYYNYITLREELK